MSTYADSYADAFSPALVSEVPALARAAGTTAPTRRSGLLARLRDDLAGRRDSRSFERAISNAGYTEAHDLLAARRRD